jgi:hypothetical protein
MEDDMIGRMHMSWPSHGLKGGTLVCVVDSERRVAAALLVYPRHGERQSFQVAFRDPDVERQLTPLLDRQAQRDRSLDERAWLTGEFRQGLPVGWSVTEPVRSRSLPRWGIRFRELIGRPLPTDVRTLPAGDRSRVVGE